MKNYWLFFSSSYNLRAFNMMVVKILVFSNSKTYIIYFYYPTLQYTQVLNINSSIFFTTSFKYYFLVFPPPQYPRYCRVLNPPNETTSVVFGCKVRVKRDGQGSQGNGFKRSAVKWFFFVPVQDIMVLQMLISSIVFDYFSPLRLSSSLSFFLF